MGAVDLFERAVDRDKWLAVIDMEMKLQAQ